MKTLLFKLKLRQGVFALSLFAGLLFSGKAKACTAFFSYTTNKLAVTFTDSGSTSTSDPHTTSWSFGDSSTATTDDPHHTYSKSGTYHVCVTVYDTKTSCSASYCANVTVSNCALVSSFSYAVLSVSSRRVKFTNTGSTSSNMLYEWNFEDGSTDTTTSDTVTHVFSGTDNSYRVYLSLRDIATGCTALTSEIVTLCNASSRIGTNISGKTVIFSGDSTNNAKDTYAWTLGDGSTQTSKSFTHTYSNWGSYSIILTVTDPTSSCSSRDSTGVNLFEPTYCITGSVAAGSAATIAPFRVYVIAFNNTDSSLTVVDSQTVNIDSDLNYVMCGFHNGTYYIKAALLPSCPLYSSYVPTYHNDALRWKTAVAITINGKNITGANVNMKSGTNPGGPGFIGGKISAGANKVGDPESGVEVVVYDASANPVAYTYSDINGLYGFSNLAYGTYSIEADIPGKTDYPISVTISASNPKPSRVNLIVNSKTIVGNDLSGIEQVNEMSKAMVYPNPVTDKMRIVTNLQVAQNGTIQIFDETGKMVSTADRNLTTGQQTVEIDATSLHSGIYFVKIQLQKNNQTLEARFVKAQ